MDYIGPPCPHCDIKRHQVVRWLLEAEDIPVTSRVKQWPVFTKTEKDVVCRNRTIGAVLRCHKGHFWRIEYKASVVA